MDHQSNDHLTPAVKQTVLALLRSALWGRERFPFSPAPDTDWKAVYTELHLQAVQHLCVDVLASADRANMFYYIQNLSENVRKWHQLMEQKQELMDQNEMTGHMFKMKDDPRVFPVGKFMRKFSIDELPQFWNILKGDMSLVGTRPPTEEEFASYEAHHKARLGIKPGLTGMWQVSGRSDIQDFEEVVELDTYYIVNWSLFLDFKIIFKTLQVVVSGKGSE